MAHSLAGKGAVVTGAGQGIGRAIALALAAVGANVGCLDCNESAVHETVALIAKAAGRAEALVGDVSDRLAVKTALDGFGARHGISVLVNNAMWIEFGLVQAMAEADIDRMLATGIKGALWSVQAAHPFLLQHAHATAAIVNVTSAAAFQGTLGFSVYAAVKGALVALTRQNAVELGKQGIRVNAVAPGPVPTEGAVAQLADPDDWAKRSAQRTPLGRIGTADEIASAVLFLASPSASWINGQIVVVDGGRLISAF